MLLHGTLPNRRNDHFAIVLLVGLIGCTLAWIAFLGWAILQLFYLW